MSDILVNATKEKMHYSEQSRACSACKHSKEEADMHLDRSWHWVCYYSNLCPFVVKPAASCNHFEAKK